MRALAGGEQPIPIRRNVEVARCHGASVFALNHLELAIALIDFKGGDRIVSAVCGIDKFAVCMNTYLGRAFGYLAREFGSRYRFNRLPWRHRSGFGIVIENGNA